MHSKSAFTGARAGEKQRVITLVVPANLADLTGMIALATNIAKGKPASAAGV